MVTRGAIWQLQMRLLKSWRWQNSWKYEMTSSPDTLRVLLAGFASRVWIIVLAFKLLGRTGFACSSRFCNSSEISSTICQTYCDQLRLHVFLKCFWSLPRPYGTVRTRKAGFPELDYVGCSSVYLNLTYMYMMYGNNKIKNNIS